MGYAIITAVNVGRRGACHHDQLEVEVYGRAVRFYLNGELCFEMTAPDKEALSGNTALIGNNCAGWFKDVLYAAEE